MFGELWLERVLELGVGAFFMFHGLNGFLHWFPIPQQSPAFERFIQALYDSKFIMPVVKAIEVLAGLLLLIGIWPLFATALLAPLVFVIVGAHVFLNPAKGWRMALLTALLFLVLVRFQAGQWHFLFR